jgi:outer membrane lipoprotein-sorting protein
MKRFIFWSVFIGAILFHAAAEPSGDWEALKEAAKNLRTVKAEFHQKRFLQILKGPLLSEGRFFFDSAGGLRWEYQKPLRSLILQKGDQIRVAHFSDGVWKPDMTQAVEARRLVLGEIRHWMQGRYEESKTFKFLFVPGPPAKVVLTPVEGIAKFINRVEIFISAKPGIIDRVEIEEPGDSRTVIEFRNVEINSILPAKIFDKP